MEAPKKIPSFVTASQVYRDFEDVNSRSDLANDLAGGPGKLRELGLASTAVSFSDGTIQAKLCSLNSYPLTNSIDTGREKERGGGGIKILTFDYSEFALCLFSRTVDLL